MLDEQAAEHAKAIDRANALAAELATVMSNRDSYQAQAKSLTAVASLHNDEVSDLRTTTDDLSRQVQGLLRQIAIRDDPALAIVSLEDMATADGDVITDQLLEFKSIRSLQNQNQRLLRLTRGLMAKLDAREVRRATSDEDDVDTGATLDQATETIDRLHAQLLEAQKKITGVTSERDFFSQLLAKGEGLNWTQKVSFGSIEESFAPHLQTIATLQAEIDVVRIQAEKEIAQAKEQATKKTEQANLAEVEKVRAEAKSTLMEGDYVFVAVAKIAHVTKHNTDFSSIQTAFRSKSTSTLKLSFANCKAQ